MKEGSYTPSKVALGTCTRDYNNVQDKISTMWKHHLRYGNSL